MASWENCPAVERVPWLLGGAWVFKGSRVPLYLLFDNLARGVSIDDFALAQGVEKYKLEAVLNYAANEIEQLRLSSNIRKDAPEPKKQPNSLIRIILAKLSIHGVWLLVVWPFLPAFAAALVVYQALDKSVHTAISEKNVHHHLAKAAADGHLHLVEATSNGHYHTYHAAMVALLVATILIVPFVAPAGLSLRTARVLKAIRLGLIASGTLISAYLWVVSDAGTYAWDQTFAALVGSLVLLLILAALGISIMVGGVFGATRITRSY